MKKQDKIVVLNDYKSHTESEIPVSQKERAPKRRFRRSRIRFLKLFGSMGLFLILLYLLGYLPFFLVDEIGVEGNQALTSEKAVSLFFKRRRTDISYDTYCSCYNKSIGLL